MLCIIGANAAEDITTIDDSAIAKNQTEDIEESDFADVSNLTADQGNWTVGECIIVKMATQLTSLEWSDDNPDQTSDVKTLNRNLTLHFSINQTSSSYGVSKISAVYEHRTYLIQVNTTNPDNTTTIVNQTVLEYISMSINTTNPDNTT